jgi:hypothetical protein
MGDDPDETRAEAYQEECFSLFPTECACFRNTTSFLDTIHSVVAREGKFRFLKKIGGSRNLVYACPGLPKGSTKTMSPCNGKIVINYSTVLKCWKVTAMVKCSWTCRSYWVGLSPPNGIVLSRDSFLTLPAVSKSVGYMYRAFLTNAIYAYCSFNRKRPYIVAAQSGGIISWVCVDRQCKGRFSYCSTSMSAQTAARAGKTHHAYGPPFRVIVSTGCQETCNAWLRFSKVEGARCSIKASLAPLEEDNCILCLEAIKQDDAKSGLLPCNHWMHTECFKMAVMKRPFWCTFDDNFAPVMGSFGGTDYQNSLVMADTLKSYICDYRFLMLQRLHHYSYHECPTPGCRGLMTRLHIVLNGIHINHPEPFGFDGETAIMDPSQFYEKRQAYIVLTEYTLKDPIYIPTL